MEAIEYFKYLETVQKVKTELSNHFSINDKDVAEFVIHLFDKSDQLTTFQQNLSSSGGAEFTDQFTSKLYKLIQRLRPNNSTVAIKGAATAADDVGSTHSGSTVSGGVGGASDTLFPALAIPNDPVVAPVVVDSRGRSRNSVDRDERGRSGRSDRVSSDRSLRRDRSRSRDRGRDRDRDRGRGRDRGRDRYDRSRSRDRGRHERGRDRYDRSRGRDRRSRSRSKDRGRDRYDRSRGRDRRSRSRSKDRGRDRYDRRGRRFEGRHEEYSRVRHEDLDDEPIVGKVYDGRVSSIKHFGAFVRLEGVKGRRDGLVHISELTDGRVNMVEDVVRIGMKVKIKVKNLDGRKIGLTMKEVDQITGDDLYKTYESNFDEDSRDTRMVNRARKERLTSPKRWEENQLIAAGIIKPSETIYDEDRDFMDQAEENVEDIEIERNESEPTFLKGQLAAAERQSPQRVVKNPESSMARSAMYAAQKARERRDLKDANRKAKRDKKKTEELSKLWEDPLAKREQINDFHTKQSGASNIEEVQPWKSSDKRRGIQNSYGKITELSISEQRRSLPIYALRDQLLEVIGKSKTLIVVGETGSGKTTQMTQYLAEVGYTERGIIGCTQPRRVAAMSVAKRVAEEVGCRVGQEVGYSIRFEDRTSRDTKIKYMTDGMLLRECLIDPNLERYSVIILDEAHERTVQTDVLFGLLKDAVARRGDLKLIVTSATLDAGKFSKYYSNSDVFKIPGRVYPVATMYVRQPEPDYLDAALATVVQIHLTEPPGDILVFLTGQEEIDTACQVLFERMKKLGDSVPELVILPIYSALPSEMQSRIFEPAPLGGRKVVIATNIAETSVTIDGIYYVVDPGFVKQNVYNPKTGMDALVVCPISKAAAKQRAGRAGRTGPGKCFRLYTAAAHKNEMLDTPVPEIQRTNMASTVLTLKALGINDLLHFDFMDPPSESSLISALYQLYTLGALDDEGLLTTLGRNMSEFPLDPPLAKMLLTSVDIGCSDEILTIVAMLSVQNVFHRPKDKQTKADQKKAKFHQPEGDHITFLCVYDAWKRSRMSENWCKENFIQARAMRRAEDIRKQLIRIMDRQRLDLVSAGRDYDKIRRALVAGYFAKAARKDPQEGYRTLVEDTPVYIHPSSALFQRNPDWVIYHELVQTSKEYMREITAIEPSWLVNFAPSFYKVADASKITERKKNMKLEPLYDKYRDANDWRITRDRPI
eukprot:TRINITY_DN1231_c0_g1_i1.p1 TRINITY_DN1231_c0_g1~~TRINITY_DN1231_c0_g1_i1.p1  ORF type:complete len:1213 (+),score=370.17 TRINITY_DN1231_c0_g1_i1:438-4076(+)